MKDEKKPPVEDLEDIGQTTTHWGPLTYHSDRRVTATLSFQRVVSQFRPGEIIGIQERLGSPGSYTWLSFSGISRAHWAVSIGAGTANPRVAVVPPRDAFGTYRFLLRRSSAFPNVPPSDDISDSIFIPAAVLWGTPAYCSTSNTVQTLIRFGDRNNNGFITGNLSVTGFTGDDIETRNENNTATVSGWTHSVGGGTNNSFTVTSTPPRNTRGTFRLRLKQNSVTVGTQTSGFNEISNPFTIEGEDMPAITFDSGHFCPTNRRINWQAYITGTVTETEIASLGTSDITVNKSDSSLTTPTVTLTRTPSSGSSYSIQTSAIPTNRTGNLSITVRANALGANTNPFAVTSGCVAYDTRPVTTVTRTPTVTITSGGVEGRTAYLYAYWEDATTAQLGMFTAVDITITGATGATATVGSRMGGAFPITINNLPDDTNSNFKITITANALGTGTNVATDSACIPYDTRTVIQESPYLEVTSIPSGTQTADEVMIDFDAKLAGSLVNIDGLRAEDLRITGPHAPYTFSLEAI